MRRFILTAVVLSLAALALAARGAAAEDFLAGFEDIPVMPGLAAVEDAGIAFDTPGGRIVESYAAGRVTRRAVLDFYGKTLPQLGWTAAGPETFRREGETLSLYFLGKDGDLTVRFMLSPASAAARNRH